MFRNLKAEMARNNLKSLDIAGAIGITKESFNNKMSGKTEFTRADMVNIRNKFFPGMTLEYLFEAVEKSA